MPTYNNNNKFFLCANILEDQAQWHDKTKGLNKLVIVKQCVSRQWNLFYFIKELYFYFLIQFTTIVV